MRFMLLGIMVLFTICTSCSFLKTTSNDHLEFGAIRGKIEDITYYCAEVRVRMNKTGDGTNVDSLWAASSHKIDSLLSFYSGYFGPGPFSKETRADSAYEFNVENLPSGEYTARIIIVPHPTCVSSDTEPYHIFGIRVVSGMASLVNLGFSTGIGPERFPWVEQYEPL